MCESVAEEDACPACGAEPAEHLRHDPEACARRAERRAVLRAMRAEIIERERELADARARYLPTLTKTALDPNDDGCGL